jgi:hypothetical protein
METIAKATAKKSGGNYYPAIKQTNGNIIVLWGSPLVNRKTAVKYAQLEINLSYGR